jgi:hypothetical protein
MSAIGKPDATESVEKFLFVEDDVFCGKSFIRDIKDKENEDAKP